MLHLQARVYWSRLRRFVQADNVDGRRYSYVGGDPANARDASGHFATSMSAHTVCVDGVCGGGNGWILNSEFAGAATSYTPGGGEYSWVDGGGMLLGGISSTAYTGLYNSSGRVAGLPISVAHAYVDAYKAANGADGVISVGDGATINQAMAWSAAVNGGQATAETTVIITRSLGFGTHAGLFVDRSGDGSSVLYDPGGSYVPGGEFEDQMGGEFRNASLAAYVNFERQDSGSVQTFRFDTTADEERLIAQQIEMQGDMRGGQCAIAVSQALQAAPRLFGSLDTYSLPGNLASALTPSWFGSSFPRAAAWLGIGLGPQPIMRTYDGF